MDYMKKNPTMHIRKIRRRDEEVIGVKMSFHTRDFYIERIKGRRFL